LKSLLLKKLKEKVFHRPDRLFGKITIESTFIRVDEFDYYTATVNAAEAFSKCILTKSKKEVIDIINKIKGTKFKVSDFTGDVNIGLLQHSIHRKVFKVTFEMSEAAKKKNRSTSPVDITLITKTEKTRENITQKDTNVSKEIFSTNNSLIFGNEFEYQGSKYFIE